VCQDSHRTGSQLKSGKTLNKPSNIRVVRFRLSVDVLVSGLSVAEEFHSTVKRLFIGAKTGIAAGASVGSGVREGSMVGTGVAGAKTIKVSQPENAVIIRIARNNIKIFFICKMSLSDK
jgi:hypothetical protein